MEHAEVNNDTPFSCDVLHMEDEDGQFICCVIAKATFRIEPDGRLTIAEDQVPLNLAGEHWGDPNESSYKYEPETAFIKPATDVVLIGHAYSSARGQTYADVGVKVGSLQKVARVFGDRYWVKTGGSIVVTRPRPFERIPLIYERAFGGWDKADKDENNWRYDPRNPVGVGFGDPLRFVEEGKVPVPNIEDPQHLIQQYGDAPPPVGFGFISPDWQLRAQYAGTYDDVWDKERKPRLPHDFDRRFFNAASAGLIGQGYLRGDEGVMIVNVSPIPKLKFNLPGGPPPVCEVRLRGGRDTTLNTNLDTVIINSDEMLVFLLWRAFVTVKNGPFDVTEVNVTCSGDLKKLSKA